MPGRMEFDVSFGRTGRPRDDSEPMRLLMLGDFSGKPVAERLATGEPADPASGCRQL